MTTFACRLGRHDWATEMRRFDDVEAARPVDVCRRCGKSRSAGQFDFGRGSAGDTGAGRGAPDLGGDAGMGGF
ncbi:hypothetical protein GCM10022204_04200 [Microlunatus aurantiacus]|uniref:Uncharacterized protein n=1 Tax=Microlunatus aurantiacus TaxID=446786 RepID=A0ABP7CNR0_9ACTN